MSSQPTHRRAAAAQPPRFLPRPMALAAHLLLSGGIVLVAGGPTPAQAQASAAESPGAAAALRHYDIPPGPLGAVLLRFLSESGVLLSGSTALAEGRTSPGVQGLHAPGAALAALLAGTGLDAVPDAQGRYLLRPAAATPPVEPASSAESTLPAVTVSARSEGPPAPFAGGQVARGGQLGLLGNTDLMDSPFNISSYTAELIQNQQARTVSDVLANDPSVRDAATASAPGQYLLMRGFISTEASILFNGLAGMAPNNRSSVDMAERVELLKGPSAAISGMVPDGSVGGTVMVVPKRAADEPLTRVSLDYGTRSQFGTHVDIGRRFGPDRAWGLRVNGVVRGGGSYIDHRDQQERLASVALDYRGARLRAALDAYEQRDKRDGTDYYVGFAGQPSPVPDASKPMTLGDSAKARDRMAMGRLEYDLAPRVTAFAAWGEHRYRSDWVYANPWNVDAAGNATIYSGNYRYNADLRSAEAGLRARANTGPVSHRIAVSATYFRRIGYYGSVDGDDLSSNIFNPVAVRDPGAPGQPPKTEESRLKSLALTDTMGFWNERVLLMLGLRHQEVSAWTQWDAQPYDESAVSPMVAVVLKPSASVSVYANYIQGLSQGPVAPVGEDPELDNAGEVFPPYKTRQYELGVRGEWDGFGSSLSVFQIAQPHALTVGNRFTVDGEQRNRGLEWNAYGRLGAGLRVLGGVTLIEARITKADGEAQGRKAFGVPGTQLNLGSEWDLPGVRGLTLSGRLLYTDPVYIDAANLYEIPGWTRWDAGARYATHVAGRPLVLRAHVDNLFDKSYWMGYRQGWRSGMVSRSAPRTLQLSATVDF